jgi:alkylhydroperoxidase family enzyme
MAWIQMIDEDEGGQPLIDAFAAVRGARGEIANILKIHSLRPDVLVAHLDLYRKLMFGRSELTRMERETIGVAVSVLNHCHY